VLIGHSLGAAVALQAAAGDPRVRAVVAFGMQGFYGIYLSDKDRGSFRCMITDSAKIYRRFSMRTRNLIAGVAVLVALVALGAHGAAQGKEPWAGTWKLNVAKSSYNPGPAPKSSTVVISATDGGITQTVDTVPATGAAQHWTVTAKFDGKDVAVKGNPNADMMSFKKTGDRSYQVISKRDGKTTTTAIVLISADGKTRTNRQTGVTADGKPAKNMLVYEKQ